jgi:FlaA1/EpsC-like NDP-sugar epimerase
MTAWSIAVIGLLAVALVGAFEVHRRTRLRLRFLTAPESVLLEQHLAGQQMPVDLGPERLGYLRDAVVLVAGAGSSIAGELVRQLATAQARSIVLLDNNENALYRLRQGFVESDPSFAGRLRFELANIRDEHRLAEVFRRHRPQVVFHFANYKSASLGNISPYAFVKVNVEGTRNLIGVASGTPTVQRFVYVSSDKAHTATQTYGRTKMIAEKLVSVHARRYPHIRFACIRYCNVLDASGSFAIPTFRRQIAAGEQVTIRRFADGSIPDRYFVPVHVAAGSTLVAGSIDGPVDGSATVLSFDSARIRPLRIDLLVHLLARRFGVRDVEGWTRRGGVVYVAAEPGEKRSEELGTGQPVPGAPLVELAPIPVDDPDVFDAEVAELILHAPDLDSEQLHERLRAMTDGRRAEAAVGSARPMVLAATEGTDHRVP